jgi:hypothetical protein
MVVAQIDWYEYKKSRSIEFQEKLEIIGMNLHELSIRKACPNFTRRKDNERSPNFVHFSQG